MTTASQTGRLVAYWLVAASNHPAPTLVPLASHVLKFPADSSPESSPLSSKLIALTIFAFALAVQALSALWVAKDWAPAFYAAELARDRQVLAAKGAKFQTKLSELKTAMQDDQNRWSASVTNDELNGWLAVELPEQFPRALPLNVKEPCVALNPQEFHVACRYEDGGTKAVLSLKLSAEANGQPNQFKIKILSAKVGSVPLMDQALGVIGAAMRRAKVRYRWLNRGDSPELILFLPAKWMDQDKRFRLDTIEINDGELLVSGTTEKFQRPQRRVAPRRRPSVQSNNARRRVSR